MMSVSELTRSMLHQRQTAADEMLGPRFHDLMQIYLVQTMMLNESRRARSSDDIHVSLTHSEMRAQASSSARATDFCSAHLTSSVGKISQAHLRDLSFSSPDNQNIYE